ncbi:obscurin isoform X7 [Adelges cooleyi]|uniref:obscurin isoform X7 n=1 Tax=Adelges cooleyi TaxID=133065 RepID=UPI00217F863A|nr:obscurin isoform X7 [Adelges cooleyi]
MSTYCRITGKSRGLPKPNYFPLLPPISPADAKRFCRITGKSYGLPAHHYIPVLVGRKKTSLSDTKHVVLNGYRYVFPVIEGCTELSEILKTECDDEKRYVYAVNKRRCSLIFPTSLENAVRYGDVKDIMMSETNDTVLLKLRRGNTVELEVKDTDISEVKLLEGEGFRNRPRKNTKSVKDDWRRKIFEEKEKESEAELEEEELKSKRMTFSAGQSKIIEPIKSKSELTILNTKSLTISNIHNIVKPSTEKLILTDMLSEVKLESNTLPCPVIIEPNIVDLSTAFPGVVHQTLLDESTITNLPIAPVISPINPLVKDYMKLCSVSLDSDACETDEMFVGNNIVNIDKLVKLNEIDSLIKSIHIGTPETIKTDKGIVKALKLDIAGAQKYVPGQYVQTPEGDKFIPGTTVCTPSGKMFVHGIMVQTPEGPKLLPGQIIENADTPPIFVAGQNIVTRVGESFVPGQTIAVNGEKKFFPGQTVTTTSGIGFVPGQTINNDDELHFIPGQTIMTTHGPEFVPGQFWENGNIEFTPGQSILKENGEWEFVPGVRVGSSFVPGLNVKEKEEKEFIPGRLVETNGNTSFVPGITSLDNNGNTKFLSGISIETEHGTKFVSGNILRDNVGNKQFVLGHSRSSENGLVEFVKAKSIQEAICSDEVQSGILTNNSFYPKGEKSDEVFGHMVQTLYGVEFYPGDKAGGLPAGKIVSGKLIRKNGIRFVPGIIVDEKFVPGQRVVTDRGEQFVPGQVIETHTGPKFVPGQVVETENGSKFVPGQTIETKDGVKFVPGQIVETKAGPTFIPGQIIFTEEEGSRFVPGQVVNTAEGPRFVPGRVIETGDRVTFIPGQIVETTEGLKFIAPDLHDAEDGDCKFSVQGFEVPPEELKVLQPNILQTSYFTQSREMALDSKMLEQLSLAGMSIGRHVPVELPAVDVSSLPSMTAAWEVSEKLELNNESTIKLAHIINRLCKLEIKNAYYGSSLVQSLIKKLPKNKSNETVGHLIESILMTAKSSPTAALNEMYAVLFDDGFIEDLKNPNKVNILKGIMNSFELEPKYIAEAFNEILNEIEDSKLRSAFEHITDENIELLNQVKLKINMENVNTEREAIEALQCAIINVVNEASNFSVNQVLRDKKSESFKQLISDAVALAKALGLREVASILMDILDDRRSTDILASDKITVDILRRLTVMRKLAERRPDFKETLKGMSADPHEARMDPNLRELVRESAILLFSPEAKVETSFDVPVELFSPRNSLAMEDFLVKSRRMGILLIIKNGLQAVVPREASRSVLTGQVPYSVLDEKGIHRFEPMNVLDALKLPAFTPRRYAMYNCALQRTLTEDEGTLTRDSSISLEEKPLTNGEGGGEEYEVLQEYESEPVEGADEEDELILEPGDKVVVLKQAKNDPSMDVVVKRNLLLDNSAAKHKMSVRPNKVHPVKHKSLEMDGSLVQSVDEPTKMGYVPNSILKKIPAPVKASAIVPEFGQTLSKKDAKFNRDVVLAELVETEEEFGQDIQEVVERYLNPIERNDAPRLVRDSKDIIFNNLKQISQFHNTVLISGLKYAASEPKTMGRTFLRLERDFDRHVNYCQTEPDAQDYLEDNYEVHEYFENERLKCSDDKKLSEHLKLPIQRINDYQLLLKELIKYSLLIGEDTTDLERALELMLSIPHRFNDTKFLTNIEGYHGTIHKLGRLLKHGWYYVQDAEDPKGHQRYCFLFKSRILVCKVRRISEDRSVFVLKDIIRLPEVTVKPSPDNKRVWELHHSQGEVGNYPFTFRANEDISRDQWITEINDHQNDLRELEELKEQYWERDSVSITETISESSISVTKIEHNSDDIKVQKQKDEDLFEPLKGIELDISAEIEEGLDPIERRLAPKPLKHVEEPKRPPLTLPPKEPIFECTSPPPVDNKKPEPPKEEIVEILETVKQEVKIEEKVVEVVKTIEEPPVEVMEQPPPCPPPERSPSPAEEEIESEPLKYIEGVSKPYFHTNITGTNHGAGENAIFECQVEGANSVTWLKNNMPLPSSMTHRISVTEDKDNNIYKLQINKVIESDSGTYTIKAENAIGTSTSTTQLFVENLTTDEKKSRAKANAPLFAVKLSDAELLENTHARFMIEIKGSPAPKMKFYKGNTEILNDDNRIQVLVVDKEKGIYEIVIPDVKPEDAGEYRVIASNKYSEESCSCFVTVTSEKDLWARLENHTPDISPKFTWLKNGKPFNPEDRFKVLFRDDEDSLALVFQNVKPEDAGLYTCIASTSHGKISCSAELNVQGIVMERKNEPYAPKIIAEVKEFETKILSTSILEAKVYGDPEPEVIWLKDGIQVEENERIKTMYEENTSTLVIKNVEVEDEGDYQIVAKNEIGSETETVNLAIKAAPRFKKNLSDYDGVTGKDISLTVEIEASPKPIVQWYKDSKTIKKSSRIKYVNDEVSGSYTLIILDSKMEDAGLYSVVASNQYSQISDACRVDLKMPPQFIGALSKEVETLEGDYVSLSVRVEGDPPPEVKWYFNDKLIVADNTHIKLNSEGDVHTLLISNITRHDSGKYTCEISNESGKNTSDGKLFVRCPPIFETPLNDTKAVEGDTNVEFTVQLNSYPKPTVQWFREEEEITETTTEFTCIEDGDNYKLIIKEAKTKLAGKYKCRATNEIGTYDSEATLTVMSQPMFKKGLKDIDVTEGGLLKLQVICHGSPPPEIKWFKDGKEVRSDAHIKISRDTKRVENFSLTVNLVKLEDGGEYEVRATNEMGTAVTKSIVNILAKHSTDYKDDGDESTKKKTNEEVIETVDIKEKVFPTFNTNDERFAESCVKIKSNEDRKFNISSSRITDGDCVVNSEESVVIVNSQSGEFSCVEISWEESSTKHKSYYGLVEEPKDERIIPIKIDRGLSIHTATDEEDEPFWTFENVKLHEDEHLMANRPKGTKSASILSRENSEDEDSSLNDLLKRVKKQRSDLEQILEIKNKTHIIPSPSDNSKRDSLSRYSSIDEIDDGSISVIEKLSRKYSKQEYNDLEVAKPKSAEKTLSKHYEKSEHHSLSKISSINSQTKLPERGSLTNSFLTDKSNDILPGSYSRLSTTDEKGKITKRGSYSRLYSNDDQSDLHKRESISRLLSIDDDKDVTNRRSISRLSSNDDQRELFKRESFSKYSSKEDSTEETLMATSDVSSIRNKNYSHREYLIKQSSIISDGLLSMCDESNKIDDKRKISLYSTDDRSEKPKRGSLSKLPSTEELNAKPKRGSLSKLGSTDDQSELPKRGSLSKLPSTEDLNVKPKRGSLSKLGSTDDQSELPKRGSLSKLPSTEDLNEKPKRGSLSKLGSTDDQSEQPKRGSLSKLPSTEDLNVKPKRGSISKLGSTDDQSELPKRGSLSKLPSTEDLNEKPKRGSISKLGSTDDQSEQPKRGSLSKLPSTEDLNVKPKRGSLSKLGSTDDQSELPKRGSLSKLPSTEDLNEKPKRGSISKLGSSDDQSEQPKRGSLSKLPSTDDLNVKPKRGSLSTLTEDEKRADEGELNRGLKIKKPLTDLESIKGQTVSWSITLESATVPDIEWTKNDKEVTAEFSVRSIEVSYGIKEFTFTMVIPSCKLSDAGTYRVKAKNKFESTECSARLDIVMRPEINGFRDIIVMPSTKAVFEVIINAAPKPEIIWSYNGNDLSKGKNVEIISEELEDNITKHQLVIRNVDSTYAGKYEVKAWNKVGETTAIAQLKLNNSIDERSEHPKRGSLSKLPSTEDLNEKPKRGSLSKLGSTDDQSEQPKRGSLSKLPSTEDLNVKPKRGSISKLGSTDDQSEQPKRGSLSKLPSTEDLNEKPKRGSLSKLGSTDDQSELPKRGSLSKLPSTEDLNVKPKRGSISKLGSSDDQSEQPKRGSLSKLPSTDDLNVKPKRGSLSTLTEDEKRADEGELNRGLKIKKPLTDLESIKGQTVSWSITLESATVPDIEWTKNDKEVTAEFSVRSTEVPYGIKEFTFTMVIPSCKLSDAGTYRVKAKNKFESTECSARLDIVMRPEINGFRDIIVMPSTKAVFEVIINAAPKPEIIWSYNGNDLSKGKNVEIISEELEDNITKHQLVIRNVDSTYAGKYEVKAWNKVGETTAIAQLKLNNSIDERSEHPKRGSLSKLPSTEDLNEKPKRGSLSKLGSSDDQSEQPKRGSLSKLPSTDDLNVKPKRGSLSTLTEDEKRADEGELNRGLKIKKPLTDLEIIKGQTVSWSITLESATVPDIEWTKNDKEVTAEFSVRSIEVSYGIKEFTFTMVIPSCKLSDAGTYRVKAKNKFESTECSARLDIVMRPEINGFRDIIVMPSTKAVFEVIINAAPKPEIIWSYNGNDLSKGKNVEIISEELEDNITKHQLVIRNVDSTYAGKYEVKAWNKVGETTAIAQLKLNNSIDERSEHPKRGSLSKLPSTEDLNEKPKRGSLSKLGSTDDQSEQPKRGSLSKLPSTEDLNVKPKRGSISKLGSTDDQSEQPKRGSLSKLPSTEDLNVKPKRGSISKLGSTDDKSEQPKRGSLSKLPSTDDMSYKSNRGDETLKSNESFKRNNTDGIRKQDENRKLGVPPEVISGMDDIETYESLTQVFDVKARGAPKPKIKWFKDGKEISKTRNIQIIDSDEEECFKLIVTDLRVADSGTYTCQLTNEVGETSKSANLNVQDVELLRGPKIKKPLNDLEIIKGQKVAWSFTLVADPVPDVLWTCNGKEVNADFSVSSVEIANGLKECTFTMTIPSSELSDTGIYQVKATNKFDSAECSARLDIVMRPEIEGFHDITVIPSMEAVFEAIIKAVPKPKISWTINGKDLSERNDVELLSEELEENIMKFKIIIRDVEPEEAGEYNVKAWNKVGETTASAKLKLHTEIPSFVKLLEDKTIEEYKEVQLTVRVNGVPKPKVTWYKNGDVVIPDLRVTVHTNEDGQVKSTLTIDHFSDLEIATFSVKAVNMVGEAETSSKMTMAEIIPSFVKPFERITEAIEGCPLEIQAELIGSPRPSVKWYKDGEELKEDEPCDGQEKHIQLETNPDGSILLKIDKVEQGDCGAYKIIATNDFGKSTTNTALVVTETPKTPIIIKNPKDVNITEGDAIKIEAQYQAHPAALIKWYKDGHLLYPCPQLDFVMGPNGYIALIIEKSKLEDAGIYEVVISNELGKASSQAKATVIPAPKAPEFITPLKNSKVVEGFPAKFQIQLSGYPHPELSWTVNGSPLNVDGEKVKLTHGPDGLHYLLIEKTSPELTGKITVTASNDHGTISSEANLAVTSKTNSEASESEPIFLHGLRDTTVEESNLLTLSAPFLGNPIPEVKWEKDGKVIQPCNRIHFSCDGYKIGLEIQDTNTGDAGKYTCTLTNKLGSTVSDAHVSIRKLYQAPIFTQRFSHNQQLLSRDAKFHARVTGVPSPIIMWHKNGRQLNNGDKYKIRRDGEVCSLTVCDVQEDDAGLYSCIATNRDGTATCEAQLAIAPKIVDKSRKQEPPSFMKKIGDCEIYDGMTAKFTACATGWPEPEYEWFFDTNRLYETERIRMEKEGSGLIRLKILHADSLIDSGRYKLRIFNPHGEAYCEASIIFDNGLDSRSKRPVGELYKDFDRYRATGAPLPLPDPPIISRMTDRRLTLTWRPSLPITPRTPVTYLVEMEEQPKGDWTTARAGIRGCACDIHNLIPFRDYKFRIRVENNYGVSDPSPFVLTFREKLEPEPPKFKPYLPRGSIFKPESSPYFPKDFDIERPPHDNYAQAPKFLHQEHDTQYGVKGHNVNLFWFVYGYPKPKMQYYFDNELIEMGGRYDSSYTRNGQATLFINKMLDRDIGVYEAVATNEHGTARQRVRLQIAEYPRFLKRPEETYVTLRKNCKLEARVVGVPYPEIKWYKDWQPLVNSARIQIEQVEPDICILRIEDVIMKDEGLYSISARNLAGSISTSVAIHIEDRESDYSNNGKTEIRWKKKDLEDLYDIGEELGRGTQGVVYHVVERSTGRHYAAKVMHAKGDHLTKLMDNEMKIMSELSNRRIIRIHEALQNSKTHVLITELAGGGELLDILTKQSFLTEYDVSLYIIQLLKTLRHMHEFDIAHLGLTPGDLLISHPGGDTLKLCDFGLSRKVNRRKLETVDYGMPEFVSPEIAKGEGVDLYSDMWSVGIITHLLLTGVSLFRCVNDADTLDRVKSGSYTLSTKISDLAKDFISKLLVLNPNDRLDVTKALKHPWLQLGENITKESDQRNTDSLRNYYNNFKDWYSNASCRNWLRRRPLTSAYSHPSKMIYPPGIKCTPSPTPEREPTKHIKHVPCWKDKLIPRDKEPIDTEIGIVKSESHYQYGPDTYLLQLRDTNFPVRLREYMKVAGKSLSGRGGSESHLDWEAPVIRERRRFTDIMDEEIEDEQKARISQYGADVYTLRRLKQEVGSRPTAQVEAEAILESRIDGQPPFFREKPQKLPIEPDKPADLMCLAVGVPKPLVQWFKNDIVLAESHRIKMLEDNDGRSILRLDPATELDLGIYKVVARNKFGQTTARARIVLAHVPGIMDAPVIKEFSDTEILVRWDHPKSDGNAPILCYQLEVRENEGEWEIVAKNIDHEFWLMQNLRPYTNYEFRLAAMNRIAWGPTGPASAVVRTSFPDCPKLEVPPAMLNLQIITENGHEIIGDEPHNNLDYSLEYKPTEWVEQPPIEKYRFISEIARGRFSVVLKGIDTTNESIIVAKLLEVTPATESLITHEFNTLSTLRHERIAYLNEAFRLENAPVAVFIQEKLQGADILTYLSTKEYYSEQMIATIVTQVLDGLQYLHWRGYAHLNLQPDNIVMASIRNIHVKLIDFGCAQKVSKLGAMVKTDSVLEFTAPEILCNEPAYPYSDIWSLGVITYILLSGMSPFRGANDIETRQNITFVRYRFEYLYKDLSQEATRFLMLLFKRTPTKRPSAEECHEHRWLLPTEYMIKKREKTMFHSFKLQFFAKEYHENRTKVATSSQKLLDALGSRHTGLGRSNSVVDELLIFK